MRVCERFLVLDEPNQEVLEAFRGLNVTVVAPTSPGLVHAYRSCSYALWIACTATPFSALFGTPRGHQSLLILETDDKPSRERLSALFYPVLIQGDNIQLLPMNELAEVLASGYRQDLFVGGLVERKSKSLILYRGDLSSLVVPLSWFQPGPASPRPDFRDFEIIDFGHTVRLGEYEASADAILYEFDRDYRRREKKRSIEQDDSFGGALRRLRLQKGLKRTAFAPISDKEIARIERGEIKTPHKATMQILGATLGVEPKMIKTY